MRFVNFQFPSKAFSPAEFCSSKGISVNGINQIQEGCHSLYTWKVREANSRCYMGLKEIRDLAAGLYDSVCTLKLLESQNDLTHNDN